MKVIIYILFLGCFSTAFGQGKSMLSGTVTDAKTGKPLAGAAIFIHEVNRGAIADDSGAFKTTFIPNGRYLVEVSFTGYETVIATENFVGSLQKNFILKEAVAEQDGVIVTGVAVATRTRQSVQPVSIAKREDLLRISSTNIINSLAHIPGVSVLSTGPAISKPFIRGLGYNRVVTINDGVRQEGQQWGDEHGIEIDDYSVQRAEVLKGPASLMYGSDAMAGVINLQSMVPATEGMIKINAQSEYQTNNRLRGFYGNVAGTKNGFTFNTYGSFKAAEDYKNKYDGYVYNSKFYNKNFGGMIGYSGSWGHSFLNLTSFDQHLGVIEGERDSTTGKFLKDNANGSQSIATAGDFKGFHPGVPYQHIGHLKLSSDNSFKLGKNKLDLVIGYQDNKRREYGDAAQPSVPDAFFNLKTLNYAARFHLPYTGNWKTSLGLTGMYQSNKNEAPEVIIPDYHLFDAGAFVFTQYHKNKFSLSGGARFDNRSIDGKQMIEGQETKFTAFTKSFSNVSGSAGISYEANSDLVLKFNIARAFRAPSLAELASNGAHEGTNRYEVGDRNLSSETSTQADAGIELRTEHITLGTSIFYNNINHFIYYRNVINRAGGDSVLTDAGTGNVFNVFKFSQQTAHLYGLEFNMDIHPHPLDWLHIENIFSFTRGRFSEAVDGSKDVPFIPAARYIAEVKGNFMPRGNTLRNFYISLESDYTFRQAHPFTGYATETATSSYWILNTSIGTDIVKKGKSLFSIHLTGSNLADIAYQSNLSRLKYTAVNNVTGRQGVFNTGRNFGIKINVPVAMVWR